MGLADGDPAARKSGPTCCCSQTWLARWPGAGRATPIEDADGDVPETSAHVSAVINGALHTPPADGRLLPGVTRDALLRAAGIEGLGISVTPLSRAQLQAASEVFVTNAVHGVRPVRSIAGRPAAWPAGPVAARMAVSLARQPPSRRHTRTASHTGRPGPHGSRASGTIAAVRSRS